MRSRGWFIQPQLSFKKIPATLHISVNPQAVKNGPRMLKDLAEACRVVSKGMPTFSAEVQQAKDLVSRAPSGKLTDDQYEQLLSIAGMTRTDVPKKMARINAILDSFDSTMREQLLLRFANDVYQHDEIQAEMEAKQFMAAKKAELRTFAKKVAPIILALVVLSLRAFVSRRR